MSTTEAKWKTAIKTWWSRWWFVDVVLLGTAIIVSISYLLFSGLLPPNSPLHDIWLNLSTDLIITWLTVRIIDHLLHRYQERSQRRVFMAGNIQYMLTIGQDLSPYFDMWRINSLQRELGWFEARLPKRKRYLSHDELQDVESVLSTVKKVIDLAMQFAELRQNIEEMQKDISHTYDQLNDQRRTLQTAFDKYRYPENGQNQRENTSNVSQLLTQYAPAFSSRELDGIKALYQRSTMQEVGKVAEAESSWGSNIYDFTKSVNYYNLSWYTKAVQQYETITRSYKIAPQEVEQVLDDSMKEYEKKQTELPQLLIPIYPKYFGMIKSLNALRREVAMKIRELEGNVETAKANIFEESEPD